MCKHLLPNAHKGRRINDLVLQNRLSAEKVHFNLQNILQPHPLIIMGGSKLIMRSFFLPFNVIIHRVVIVCQKNG